MNIVLAIIAGYIANKAVDYLGTDQGIEIIVTLQVIMLTLMLCEKGNCLNSLSCYLSNKCKR